MQNFFVLLGGQSMITQLRIMENKQTVIHFALCAPEELDESDRKLVELARQATHTAYAPYSHFCVGAALLLEGGTCVCGSNQENAAFGAGTCAERTALFYAHAQYPDAAVKAIAIAARGTDGEFTQQPIAPCGVCRQALLEAQKRGGQPIRLLLASRTTVTVLEGVECVLPFAFEEIV